MQGRVSGPDDKPLAGATVTLTTPLAAHALLAAPEVLTATTDADGSFRAALLVGRSYAVGVVGTADDQGRAAVSAIQNGVGAAQFVKLRATTIAPVPQVQFTGLLAWGEDAPRRGRLTLMHAPGITIEFAIGADGLARLPHLPKDRCSIELLTADGSTCWWDSFDAPDAEGRIPITLQPLVGLSFVVRTADGKPVPGATVEQRTALIWFGQLGLFEAFRREHWRTLGTTDEQGIVHTRVPRPSTEDWSRVFRAGKPGFAAGIAGFFADKVTDARRDPEAKNSELHFELVPEQPLTGLVETAAGNALAGTDLVVEVTHMLPMANGGSLQVPLLYPVRTDGNGHYAVLGAPAGAVRPRLLAPPALSGPGGAQLPTVLIENEGHVASLGPVRLSTLRTIDLQVLRPDGGPAEGAIAVLISLRQRHWFVDTWDPRHRLDRAGRARICPPAGECLLFCTDGESSCCTVIDDLSKRVELRGEPLAAATIRCITADGKPAAGASIRINSYSPVGDGGDAEALARAAVAVSLNQWLLADVKADEAGVARVRLLPSIAVTQVEVSHGGATSEPFSLGEGEVTVTLPALRR